jgi:hypothetical protein
MPGIGATATLTQAPPRHPAALTQGPPRPYVRETAPAKPPAPPSMALLYIWILLFGFVGTQLAWTLRPFFGSPNMAFSLYRQIDGNFYAEIIRTIGHLF